MIPDLAIIISAFVITSMVRLIVQQHPKEHGAVATCAALTIAVTMIALGHILMTGSDVANQLRNIGLPK